MNILVESVKDAFRKYFVIDGRATRPQYWYYVLALFLIGIAAGIVAAVFGKIAAILGALVWIVFFLWELAVIIPSITVAVRRLHDAGFSGWWLLLSLTGIGGIVVLVMLCLPTKN
ncbi:MAG: DUF805 domain-containing protein [Elusimicrobia bacterium]|nr:DUF805 domain-containing protein [Elusimicrobiota bacterium]